MTIKRVDGNIRNIDATTVDLYDTVDETISDILMLVVTCYYYW